jgi:malonyl-CoA/methylmalonyl-CoA synthetase
METRRVEKFPNDPIFNQLAVLATKIQHTIVYDASGLEADYNRFFHDVSKLRATLRRELPASTFNEHGMFHESSPYICILATADYDFIVSFYAILALGGAIAPLGNSFKIKH